MKEFIIPFVGLKEGIHQFEQRVKKSFFDAFGNEEILDSDIVCQTTLEKKNNMLVLDISFEGTIEAECDRCMEPCTVDVDGSARLFYKFSDSGDSDDEDVYFVPANEQEIDISAPLYDYIILSTPNRKVHEEDLCDPDVMDALDGLDEDPDPEPDPRWDALKKLKK